MTLQVKNKTEQGRLRDLGNAVKEGGNGMTKSCSKKSSDHIEFILVILENLVTPVTTSNFSGHIGHIIILRALLYLPKRAQNKQNTQL